MESPDIPPRTDEPNTPRRIVIAGGTGFLGEALVRYFNQPGIEITILSRRARPPHGNVRYVQWDAKTHGPLVPVLNGQDLVINLIGRTVNCRYNARNKAEIFASRLDSTRAIGNAIAECTDPPPVWMNAASATIYRHAEDRPQDETTGEPGHGFSVDVCQAWEKTFFATPLPHTRRVALRISIAIAAHNDYASNHVMKPLHRLVRFGLGGRQGNGRQMFSWIHVTDFCRAIEFLYATQHVSGPVNLAAPGPLPNADMMRTLRQRYRAPFGLPAPVWMLKLGAWLIGTETELILKSRWVVPTRLLAEGFRFRYPTFAAAVAK